MSKRQTTKKSHARWSRRRIGLVISCLVAGGMGLWMLAISRAESPQVPNPPLSANGKTGIDIFILGDSSNSFSNYEENAEAYPGQFLRNMEQCTGTRFVVGNIDMVKSPAAYPTAASTITALKDLDGDSDDLGDLRGILPFDTRPGVQNLVLLFSDFAIGDKSSGSAAVLKQKGSRILALKLGSDKGGGVNLATIAGPNVDKGSIYKSDVITKPNQLASQLLSGATQLCKDPPSDNNGDDSGNGSGSGGDGGSGSGTNGTGSGGGGSSATKQGDSPKAVPKPAPQGVAKQDPPETEPSPFFDGKQYSIGSDPDAQTPADLATHPQKALGNVWFYVATALVLAASGGGYWWWRKRKLAR